jgi:phage FluMu protein Com
MYAINEIRKLLNNYKKRLKYRFSPDEDTKIYLVKCKKCNKTIMVYAYEPLSHIEKCPKCIKLQQEEMALE